jgi:predicted MFS family arabinose efflux permease
VGLTAGLSLLPLPFPAAMMLLFVWSTLGWSFMAGQQARLATLAGPRTPVALALNAAAIYVGVAVGAAAGGAALAAVGTGGLGLIGGLAALVAVGHIVVSHRLAPAPPPARPADRASGPRPPGAAGRDAPVDSARQAP